jgi:hypothetical protein
LFRPCANPERRLRLRQRGSVLSFSETCCALRNMFLKKMTPLQELRGARSNQAVNQMEARFACGSMVLDVSFHDMLARRANMS